MHSSSHHLVQPSPPNAIPSKVVFCGISLVCMNEYYPRQHTVSPFSILSTQFHHNFTTPPQFQHNFTILTTTQWVVVLVRHHSWLLRPLHITSDANVFLQLPLEKKLRYAREKQSTAGCYWAVNNQLIVLKRAFGRQLILNKKKLKCLTEIFF